MNKQQDVKSEIVTAPDFAQELSGLQNEIAKIRGEFAGILEAISKAKAAKEQAKRDYDSSLDAGDQEGMTSCLATIRKSNDAVRGLEGKFPAFLPKAAELRDRQSKLWGGAQAEKLKVETILRQTQENLRLCDTEVSQAHGLLTQLNNLDSFLRGEPERSL